MATNDDEVGRFGLRRGARFLETLRDQASAVDADDEWLAGLRPESVEEAAVHGGGAGDQGEPGPSAAREGRPRPSSATDVVPTLTDAMATLEDRLAVLEEALVKAAAACTVSRTVLRQLEAAMRDPSRSPGDPAPDEGTEP